MQLYKKDTMKKLFILAPLFFTTTVLASWNPRKQKASGLSNGAYEQSRQDLNAKNFGKTYSDANKTRMEKATSNETIKKVNVIK